MSYESRNIDALNASVVPELLQNSKSSLFSEKMHFGEWWSSSPLTNSYKRQRQLFIFLWTLQLYCYRYCADWGNAIINIHVTSWTMFTILITPGQCPPVGSFWCANVIYAAYDFKEIVENSIFRPNSAPGTKPGTTIKRNGGWRKQMIRLLNFCKAIWN